MITHLPFVAFDVEAATSKNNTICSVALVTVQNGCIVDEFYTLVRPPKNEYSYHSSSIHGIRPWQTQRKAEFPAIFQEDLAHRLKNTLIVAHNAAYDRTVLRKVMQHYALDAEHSDIEASCQWQCTNKIYKKQLDHSASRLNQLCARYNIQLQHHNALSDTRACAQLFFKWLQKDMDAELQPFLDQKEKAAEASLARFRQLSASLPTLQAGLQLQFKLQQPE